MAINPFSEPVQQNIMDTYVPAPFQEMAAMSDVAQKRSDTAMNAMDKTMEDLMKVQYVPGSEDEKTVKEKATQLQGVIDKYQGEPLWQPEILREARRELRSIARDPLLGKIQMHHDMWADNNKVERTLHAQNKLHPMYAFDPTGFDSRIMDFSHMTQGYDPADLNIYFNNIRPDIRTNPRTGKVEEYIDEATIIDRAKSIASDVTNDPKMMTRVDVYKNAHARPGNKSKYFRGTDYGDLTDSQIAEEILYNHGMEFAYDQDRYKGLSINDKNKGKSKGEKEEDEEELFHTFHGPIGVLKTGEDKPKGFKDFRAGVIEEEGKIGNPDQYIPKNAFGDTAYKGSLDIVFDDETGVPRINREYLRDNEGNILRDGSENPILNTSNLPVSIASNKPMSSKDLDVIDSKMKAHYYEAERKRNTISEINRAPRSTGELRGDYEALTPEQREIVNTLEEPGMRPDHYVQVKDMAMPSLIQEYLDDFAFSKIDNANITYVDQYGEKAEGNVDNVLGMMEDPNTDPKMVENTLAEWSVDDEETTFERKIEKHALKAMGLEDYGKRWKKARKKEFAKRFEEKAKRQELVSFIISDETAAKKSDLHKYQKTLNDNLMPGEKFNMAMIQGMKIINSKTGEDVITSEHFGEEVDDKSLQRDGIKLNGFGYDEDLGWYAAGTMTKLEKIGNTTKKIGKESVIFQTPDMQSRIMESTGFGGIGETLNVLQSLGLGSSASQAVTAPDLIHEAKDVVIETTQDGDDVNYSISFRKPNPNHPSNGGGMSNAEEFIVQNPVRKDNIYELAKFINGVNGAYRNEQAQSISLTGHQLNLAVTNAYKSKKRTLAFRNKNPFNIKDPTGAIGHDSQGHAIFSDFEKGLAAGRRKFENIYNTSYADYANGVGASKSYHKEMTLEEFSKTYATSKDDLANLTLALEKLGEKNVTSQTLLEDIDMNTLMEAVIAKEDSSTYRALKSVGVFG